jgi:CheY-like chemotaxis protein
MDKFLTGRRVLVVEDEMLVLMMIEGMLEDLGCDSVTAAARVNHAVALIEGQFFDVAMLDVNLGGTDSKPVADALAARSVPFFYSTGNTGHKVDVNSQDRPVLKKPFEFEALADILKRLLA